MDYWEYSALLARQRNTHLRPSARPMLYFTYCLRDSGRACASGTPCSVSLLPEESMLEFVGDGACFHSVLC